MLGKRKCITTEPSSNSHQNNIFMASMFYIMWARYGAMLCVGEGISSLTPPYVVCVMVCQNHSTETATKIPLPGNSSPLSRQGEDQVKSLLPAGLVNLLSCTAIWGRMTNALKERFSRCMCFPTGQRQSSGRCNSEQPFTASCDSMPNLTLHYYE